MFVLKGKSSVRVLLKVMLTKVYENRSKTVNLHEGHPFIYLIYLYFINYGYFVQRCP